MCSQGNTEFTKKLRAAVKAKIEEFGLDVDDELPDYVMIMVGNKKTRETMKSDLKLFLGDNTSAFVEWLFGFFRKVKSATGSCDLLGGETEAASNADKSHSSDGKKRSESQSHAKSHSTAAAKKESSGRSQSKAGRHEIKLASKSTKDVRDPSKSRTSRHPQQHIESTRHHSRSRGGNYEDAVVRREHAHHQSPPSRRPTGSESRHHPQRSRLERDWERRRSPSPIRNRQDVEEYMSDDENALSGYESDTEGGELRAVGGGFKKFSSPKELREPAPPSPRRLRVKNERGERKAKEQKEDPKSSINNASKPPADPTPSNTASQPIRQDQLLNPAIPPVAPKPRLKSQVQVVMPAGGRQVELIGCGRRNSGYGDGRGLNHPNLFKRAITDVSAKHGGGPLAQLASRRTLPVGNHQIELNYDIDGRRQSKDEGEEEVVEVGLNAESDKQSRQKIVVTMKRELLEKSGVLIVGGADEKTPEPEAPAELELRSLRLKRVPTPPSVVGERRKRRADDLSRAFLRLSGMTPAKTGRVVAKQEANQASSSQKAGHLVYDDVEGGNDSPSPKERDGEAELANEGTEAKEMSHGELSPTTVMAKSQSATAEDSRMVLLDYNDKEVITPMTPIVWDGQIKLDQDDASSSDDDNEEEIDQVLATVAAIRQEHISIAADKIVPPTAMLSRPNLYYAQSVVAAAMGCQDATAAVHLATLGYNPDEYQTSLVPAVRSALQGQKIMERCRFWPECRNEDLCAYHHPTKVCQKFPNCWFGEKCLNIHPRCRFAPNCTKPNCRFSHYKLPVNIFSAAASSQQQPGSSAPGENTQSATTASSSHPIPINKPMNQPQHSLLSNRCVTLASPSPITHVPGRPPMAHAGPSMAIPCRYGGHCQNLACVYKHPPPCRFGSICANPGCPFLHRGTGTSRMSGGGGIYGGGGAHSQQGRFKWTSPTLSTLQ